MTTKLTTIRIQLEAARDSLQRASFMNPTDDADPAMVIGFSRAMVSMALKSLVELIEVELGEGK